MRQEWSLPLRIYQNMYAQIPQGTTETSWIFREYHN